MSTKALRLTSIERAKAAEAARRRTRRRRWVVASSIVAALALITLVVIWVAPRSSSGPSASTQVLPSVVTGVVTVESPASRVADTSGIAGVIAWDTEGWPGDGASHAGALEHTHVDGPVRYAVVPPVGGPHSAVWMNAGVYTAPIPNERAVHNLEHGAVWITYDPSLGKSAVAALTAFVTKQTAIPEPPATPGAVASANRYVDLSPWGGADLPSPIVVSSWGHQLRLTDASDPRLQQFVDTFRASARYSPEYGSPVDGVPTSTGGVPAVDGSTRLGSN